MLFLSQHYWFPCIFDVLPAHPRSQGLLNSRTRGPRPGVTQLPVEQAHSLALGELQFAPVLEPVVVTQTLTHLHQC